MNFRFTTLATGLLLSSICFGQQTAITSPELQQAIRTQNSEPIELNIVFQGAPSRGSVVSVSATADRESVINRLKSEAQAAQAEVLALLKREEAKGNVKNIESFWVSNSITCQTTASVVDQLTRHSGITHIGLNREIQLLFPEDAEVLEQSTMSRDSGSVLPHITQVNADDVWNLGYTGKNIVVAILDSGTNTDHYDIREHLWRGYVDTDGDDNPDTWVNGWNFISDNSNITDDYKHGSHCAGIVAGDGSSGMKSGVAPDASIMTLKTVNRAGGGSPTNMIKAVEFALENGADILSMSLGFKNSQIDDATKAMIRKTFENTLAAGVVACAAVGNDGNTYGAPNNVDVPASCPPPYLHPDQKAICEGGLTSIISVGSVNSNDEYVNTSSCGPSTWDISQEGQYDYTDYPYDGETNLGLIRPDICAPGEWIYSLNHTRNNKYAIMSGTSMATPCVAGVIALMLEKNPDLTPAQICEILETTAKKLSDTKSNSTGSGRIDALAAINAIEATGNKPYVRLTEYPTNTFIPGDGQNLKIRLTNTGKGAWTDATVTVTTDDRYVTMTEGSQPISSLDSGETTAFNFPINISEDTPNGHVAYFNVSTNDGTTTYTDKFRITVNAEAIISYQGFSPYSLPKGTDATLTVTVKNTGNIPTGCDSKLILSTTAEDVSIISGEAIIEPLGVNESTTCDFVVNIDNNTGSTDIRFYLQSIPNNYNQECNLIYQFEINPEDPVYDDGSCNWTTFDASVDDINPAWPFWHSSLAKKNALSNVGELLHSGESHMISEAFCYAAFIDQDKTIPTDNYLVSPKIKATANSKITFWARCHQNYTNPGEHFGVAVSESGNTDAADFTMLQEWDTEGADWRQYSVDLSAYAGKEIYVAIRHFFSQEEWIAADYGYNYYTLNIDDIQFEKVVDASFIFHDKNMSPFRVSIGTSGIDNIAEGDATVSISVDGRQICVKGLADKGVISLYDIAGREALTAFADKSEAMINAEHLQSGIYIVRVNDSAGTTAIKVRLD